MKKILMILLLSFSIKGFSQSNNPVRFPPGGQPPSKFSGKLMIYKDWALSQSNNPVRYPPPPQNTNKTKAEKINYFKKYDFGILIS